MNIKETVEAINNGEIKFDDKVWICCYSTITGNNSGLERLRDIPPEEVIIKNAIDCSGYPRKWGYFYFKKIGKKGKELSSFYQSESNAVWGDGKVHTFKTKNECEKYYEHLKSLLKIEYKTVVVPTFTEVKE